MIEAWYKLDPMEIAEGKKAPLSTHDFFSTSSLLKAPWHLFSIIH